MHSFGRRHSSLPGGSKKLPEFVARSMEGARRAKLRMKKAKKRREKVNRFQKGGAEEMTQESNRLQTSNRASPCSKQYLLDYAKVLEPSTSWLVAVKCDLDIVRAREAKRAGRFPGTADSHYDSIHEHGVTYDIEVNTSRTCASALAREIIEGMKSPPRAFTSLIDD